MRASPSVLATQEGMRMRGQPNPLSASSKVREGQIKRRYRDYGTCLVEIREDKWGPSSRDFSKVSGIRLYAIL